MGMLDTVIQKILADRLESRGLDWIDVRNVRLSKAEKLFELDLMLEGEERPLQAKLHYAIKDEALHITSVETSKRWITEVLQLVLVAKGGAFALPGGVVGMLVRVLI